MIASPARNAAARVDIDASLWPIVIVTPPTTPMTDALIEAFKVEWIALMERRTERYVCVNDLRHAPAMGPAQRRNMTDWMNEKQSDLAAKCCGTAMVFDSMLMRGTLTAMLWMFRPPYPTDVFKTREEAITWSRALIERSKKKEALR